MAAQTANSTMPLKDMTLSQRVMKRWSTLNRVYVQQGWLQHHQQLAVNILPRKGRYLRNQDLSADDNSMAGAQVNGQILNSTATAANRTLTSGMMSSVTNPARKWFRFDMPLVAKRDKDDAESTYFYHVMQVIQNIFAESNVYQILPQAYSELGVFGTGVIYVEPDFDNVMNLTLITVGQYRIATSAKGVVNTVYRQFAMTVMQIVDEFGKEAVSQQIKTLYENGEWDKEVIVIHAIEPNPDADATKRGPKYKPFRAVYIERDASGRAEPQVNAILRQGYYSFFPCLCPRWSLIGEDAYGNSQGMEALADIKGLYKVELRKAQIFDRLSAPTMQGPPSLRNEKKSLIPGSFVYVADPTGKGMRPAYVPNAQALQEARVEISAIEQRINVSFFRDLFMQMLMSDRREMTAEEVRERAGEKLVLLSPILQQIEKDLLVPLIRMAYTLAAEAGILMDPPESLVGMPVRIRFVSLMHQALQMGEINSIERFLAFVGNVAAFDPAAYDNVESDVAIREYGETLDINPAIIRDTQDVMVRRQQKQQEQQRQQMIERTPELIKGAELLSKAQDRAAQ